MYRGSLLLRVPTPLMRTVVDPLGLPSAEMFIPGTFPCIAFMGLFSFLLEMSSMSTTDTEPVRSALRCTV